MARIDLGNKLPNYLHNNVFDFFGVKKWPQGYRITTITKNIHLFHVKNCWSYHSYQNNAQIFFEKSHLLARIEPCLLHLGAEHLSGPNISPVLFTQNSSWSKEPAISLYSCTRWAWSPSSSWESSLPGFTVSVNDSMNQQLCCNWIMRRHLKNNFGGCQ